MKKAAIFGFGNVGKCVAEAIDSCNDFEIAGIVDTVLAGNTACGLKIAADLKELHPFDVAILALPSRIVPEMAEKLLSLGIATVDGFDIHGEIPAVRKKLDAVAKANNTASILSSGWDPGSDSVVRALFEAMAPRGITYTNFGPGMSMGHSVAAKAIPGVKDALSMTIPLGTSIHRRMVYVELDGSRGFAEVAADIKKDEYFAHDETHVNAVESVRDLKDMGHGVLIERKGVSGDTHNQLFNYSMKINNPALTGQMLVSSARAVLRQAPGCYTLIEIPPVDFLEMDRDEAVHALV